MTSFIGCVRREGAAAIYNYEDKLVMCEHVRSDKPITALSQVRTRVRVTLLNHDFTKTNRSLVADTTSYDEAVKWALGMPTAVVKHHC